MKSLKIKSFFLLFLLLYLLFCFVLQPALIVYADNSEKTTYSNVLDDLMKDSSFRPSLYVSKVDDYSLKVIQIGEGEKGEVFLYVYQPSHYIKDLVASKVNLSLQDPSAKNISYALYDLELVSTSGVFDKYLVKGLKVSGSDARYYTIAAIYRRFDESIDDPALDVDDIKEYEGISVGLSFAAYNSNGTVYYQAKEMEVAEVEIQSVGFTRYNDGFILCTSSCDSHFVAFSISNFDVDWVYDADITYTYKSGFKALGNGNDGKDKFGTPVTVNLTLSDQDKGSNNDGGWIQKEYSWNRISKTSTFINETKDHTNTFLDENQKNNLEKSEFVFRFSETDYIVYSGGGTTTYNWTSVTDVAILRLHFLSDGKSYNLGVVSDIVSDDGNPDFTVGIDDNIQNTFEDLGMVVKIILGIVAFIVIYIVLSFVIRQISYLFNNKKKG